ncbi:hypothetical protein [Bacillus altitudinis]
MIKAMKVTLKTAFGTSNMFSGSFGISGHKGVKKMQSMGDTLKSLEKQIQH